MSKFHNKITWIGDLRFDSQSEADYYLILRDRELKGEISDLRRQVPFEIIPAVWRDEVKHLKTKDKIVHKRVQPATQYIADFVYFDKALGKELVVDVKGKKTAAYCLKKKMMLAFNNIEITEVYMAGKKQKSGSSSRKTKVVSRPKPSAPRAGYLASGRRYSEGGKTVK